MKKLTLKLVAAGIGAATTIAALAIPVVVASGVAEASSASKPSTSVLFPESTAKGEGFTTVVSNPDASTGTGISGCPYGSHEEFADESTNLGLVSEVLYCQSAADAKKLLEGFKSNGAAVAGLTPPKGLGSTAVAREGSNSTYLFAWLRGSNGVEVIGLDTDEPTSTTTSTTTAASVPLTAHDEQLLASAATLQNARFSSVTISKGTGASAADKTAQAAANAASVAAGCPKSPATALKKGTWSSPPATIINPAKTYTATVKTDLGTFVIALDAKAAPQTVNNFVFLAEHHFFDCNIFLRVIPSFVDQTGDPTGKGNGGPGYTIPDELPAETSNPADQYPLGSVAMANTGQPNTGGSQFFIVTGTEGESLSNSYSLFGHVTSGMSILQKINAQGSASGVPPDVTHRMLKVTITTS